MHILLAATLLVSALSDKPYELQAQGQKWRTFGPVLSPAPDYPEAPLDLLPFDVEQLDPSDTWDGLHTFTAPHDGWFRFNISVSVSLVDAGSGLVSIMLVRNNTTPTNWSFPAAYSEEYLSGTSRATIQLQRWLPLLSGETVTLAAYSNAEFNLIYSQYSTWVEVEE